MPQALVAERVFWSFKVGDNTAALVLKLFGTAARVLFMYREVGRPIRSRPHRAIPFGVELPGVWSGG